MADRGSLYTVPENFEHRCGRYSIQKRGGGPGYFGAGPMDCGHWSLEMEWKEGCTGNGDLKMWFVVPDFWSNKSGEAPVEESFDRAVAQLKEMFLEAAGRVERRGKRNDRIK